MAGPLGSYQPYDDLLAQSIAAQQAKLSALPTSPLSNIDPVMMAVAQGLLSPTKTGGFGESLGMAAGNMQAPLAAMRKEKLDAQGKIDEIQLARAKLAAEAPMWNARAQHYTTMGGSGTPSIAQQRLETNDEIAIYENHDPSELGLTEEQHAAKLKALYRKKLQLEGDESTADSSASGSSKAAPKDGNNPPADYPNAQKAPNGKWYVPDPNRPGKYLEVQ
jgi:hypothetical protein